MKSSFKTWISASIFFSVLVLLFLSFKFYDLTKKPEPVTTVSSCQELVIDSIKTLAIRDTVKYFQGEIEELKTKLEQKNDVLNTTKKTISQLRKERDSVAIRLDGLRLKYADLKSRAGETKDGNK